MSKKKHKVVKVCGVKCAVPVTKDHDRALMPAPTVMKSGKEYDSKKMKRETRKMVSEYYS